MTTIPRSRFNLFLFGPDEARNRALTIAIQRYFGVERPPPTEGISLHSPWESQLPMDGTFIAQRMLPAQLFPGELLLHLGKDAFHVLILPLSWDAWLTQQRLRAVLFVLRKLNPSSLTIYLDAQGAPDDEELVALAVSELQEHLTETGWKSLEVPIIIGDLSDEHINEIQAQTHEIDASIATDSVDEATEVLALHALVSQLGQFALTTPQTPGDAPFLMPIEERFNMAGHQSIATGRIFQGTIEAGDTVILLGTGITAKRVAGIEMYRRRLNIATAGDVVGLLLDHTQPDAFGRGDILTKAPETFTRAIALDAFVHFYTKDRGGFTRTFEENATFTLHMGPKQSRGQLHIDVDSPFQWQTAVAPGTSLFAHIVLETSLWCQEGDTFLLSLEGTTVGIGLLLSAQDEQETL